MIEPVPEQYKEIVIFVADPIKMENGPYMGYWDLHTILQPCTSEDVSNKNQEIFPTNMYLPSVAFFGYTQHRLRDL